MNPLTCGELSPSDASPGSVGSWLAGYEMAVLSTLFDQSDCHKLPVLAEQWGYQQDVLQSIWVRLHGQEQESAAIALPTSVI